MNVFDSSDSGQHGCSAEESLPNIDSLDRPISEGEVLQAIKNMKLTVQKWGIPGPLDTSYYCAYTQKKGTLMYQTIIEVSHYWAYWVNATLQYWTNDWLEDNDKIDETQAGFRRGYSTSDHVFILYAMTQEHLSRRRGKLYVAFIDLRKAFDSVKRETLLRTLCKTGVYSAFVNAIKNLFLRQNEQWVYKHVWVSTGTETRVCFEPYPLFYYHKWVGTEVSENGKHGFQLLPGPIDFFILLFVDDLALLSRLPTGLQTQLDCLQRVCLNWGLTVNTDKSKVMVFRKGGFLGRSERWFIGGNILEVVNRYLYLGFTFTTAMNANEAAKQLAVVGKKSLFKLLTAYTQLGQMCRQKKKKKIKKIKIFDAMIQPVLSYSAEVWGLLVNNDPAEKVHLYACERFLNVAALQHVRLARWCTAK